MKRSVKIFFICIFSIIWLILVSDFFTVHQTEASIYANEVNLPENKVGLLLGTSKYIADGRRNLFYIYRLEAAKKLYDAGKIEYILVSGDNSSEKYNETDTMRNDLIDLWIPEDKIVGDYAGFRTLDSVVRAKEVFLEDSYTIISQEFHLQRAVFLAQKHGIDAIGYKAKDVPVWVAPRVWIRERLARVKMMLDLATWKEPKFLGKTIEIGDAS